MTFSASQVKSLTLVTHVFSPSVCASLPSASIKKDFMLMSSSLSSSTSSWTPAMEDASFSRMAAIFLINSDAADSILAFDTWYAICLQNRQVSKQ
ncbi:disease resistance protein RPM1-like [Pyrus ussuriensis x Pyrus communis]|uniref:Disease resistance protein RPM1-like n=1 Tax=Pyrus ussuriensis x Pyrus communis TaxID=2448454 RepID=A0A5N5HZ76_9ROSA|nr:disease resistance protein RPM1-like [Pyrus ussuriensis x Pyrus communis]